MSVFVSAAIAAAISVSGVGSPTVIKSEQPSVIKSNVPTVIKSEQPGVIKSAFDGKLPAASPLCSVLRICGVVYVPPASRGTVQIVKNWAWGAGRVTAKSVPASNRLTVKPGQWSSNQWRDADGFIARTGCDTWVSTMNGLGVRSQFKAAPGWAYKIGDDVVATVAATGAGCKG